MNDSFLPYIPETVTVHLGPPGSAAENVTVSFRDYVKNVASSEVYPTWQEEALRANILAIQSFALNKIFLEYYPSRGYDFDITASTAYDQKFIRGREIFGNISNLVDQLFRSYIRRPGNVEPLAAAFCNGTTVTCAGMSQWGSQALARQGYDALSILRYYYGSNIELVTDAPVMSPRPSYPGTPLTVGSRGDGVRYLQTALRAIRAVLRQIPNLAADGIFGSGTQSALITFQRIFGLAPDGIAGENTWRYLNFLYVATTSGCLNAAAATAENTAKKDSRLLSGTPFRELKLGSFGQDVLELKRALEERLPDATPRFLGNHFLFGASTKRALERFQEENALPVTGVLDEETRKALFG